MAGGKKPQASVTPQLNGIKVQSSVYGSVIPRGWGTFRVAANLLWTDNFQSIAHTSTQKVGGKGGGQKSSASTTYTYNAAVILGLCRGEGDFVQVRSVYKDKDLFTDATGLAPGKAGLSIATGALGQATWGFLTTNYPAAAIGYSGVVYAYASNYDLGSNGTVGNHSFEVQTGSRVSGLDDANPSTVVSSLLPDVPFWPGGVIGDLTQYSTYCLAAGLLLSPLLDTQRTARDFLTEIFIASNSAPYWSEGLLKVTPYGDTTTTGNATTFTPNLTPAYALTNDDFIPQAQGEDPVIEIVTRAADAYNYVQVEFLDRANRYNTQVVPGVDQGNIDQFGKRSAQSPYTLHSICDATVAGKVAQLIVQRTASVRATFKFRLGPHYILLDPTDLITITSGDLVGVLARVRSIKEDPSTGDFEVEAEQMLVGMGHPAIFNRQVASSNVFTQNNVPGSIQEYVLYVPPTEFTNGAREVWVGAAGGAVDWGGAEVWTSFDNIRYARVGIITAPTRFGLLTTVIPNVADPDNTTTFSINSGTTKSQYVTATQADHDKASTLFLVDSELMAYRDVTLVSAFNYNFGNLRRGLYSTTPASHAVGADFVRFDGSQVSVPYASQQDGATMYVKLVSFNTFGKALEDISTVTPHTIVLAVGSSGVGIATGIVGPGGVTLTYQDVYNALLKFPAKNLLRESDYVAGTGATKVDPLAITGGQALWGFTFAGGAAAKAYCDRSGYAIAAQGGAYSISFQAKIASGSGQMRAGFRVGGASGAGGTAPSDLADKIFPLTTTLTRFTWDGFKSADAGFTTAELVFFTNLGDAATTVTLTDLQIEFSTVASTGWRPSPDDVGLLRYAGFVGELTADTTSGHIASGITSQSPLATGNPQVSSGGNRLRLTDFEKGVAPWTNGTNPSGLARASTTGAAGGIPFLQFSATATAAAQEVSMFTSGDQFAVTPGEQLALSMVCGSTNGQIKYAIQYFNAAGAFLSTSTGFFFASNVTFPTLGQEMVTVPASAVTAYLEVYIDSAAAGSMVAKVGQPYVIGVPVNQAAFPPYERGASNTSGADVTSANIASGINLQGSLATQNAATWSTQVTGAGKPTNNADVTSANIAASVNLQGALATQSAATWSTQVTGAGKPTNNADVTSANIAASINLQGALATLNDLSTKIAASGSASVSTAGGVTTISASGGATVLTVGIPSNPFWSGVAVAAGAVQSTSNTGTPTCSGGTGVGRQSYWTISSGDPCTVSTPSGAGLFAVTCSRSVKRGDALSATLRLQVIDSAGNYGFAECNVTFTDTF